MNVAGVRRMTKLARKDNLLNLPPQRVTVRCADCRWYQANVLLSESSRGYASHRGLRHA